MSRKLASEAMAAMQGTYQYWGARLFSYFEASAANSSYAFQVQVNSAARLWVNNTLVIEATCRSCTLLNCDLVLWVFCSAAESPQTHATLVLMLQVLKMVLSPPQTVTICGTVPSLLRRVVTMSQLSTTTETEEVH